MCRYACDLQPMLKVLAGPENIHKLLDINIPVRFRLLHTLNLECNRTTNVNIRDLSRRYLVPINIFGLLKPVLMIFFCFSIKG